MTSAGSPVRPATRRTDIQGMRAVAATLIVAFHAGALVPGGFFAVDIFFVISGFVITAMLLREHRATGSISLRRFYARRARRLLPSLALVVAVTMLLGVLLLSPFTWGQLAPAGMSSLFAVSNVYFAVATDGYFQTSSDAAPLLHTWSLSVEEQFYLVFPTIVLVLLARGRRLRVLVWAVAIVTALSFVLCVVLTLAPLPGALSLQAPRLAFYSPMTRAWEFGAGALVAFALQRLGPSRWAGPLGWAGLGVLALAFVVVDESSFPGWSAALPVAATVLLILSGGVASEGGTAIGRVLSTRPMTWLGDRSYTWYLWHWPLIVLVRQWWPGSRMLEVVAGVVSLGVAALVYRWFERPIHEGSARWTRKAAPVLLTTVGAAVACCAVAFVGSATSFGDEHLRAQRDTIAQQHLDQVRGCDAGTVVGDGGGVPPACRFDVDGSRGRLLLIGDSHAGHYTEAFLAAAANLGYSADVATFPSCPFVLGEPADAACASFVRDNVDALSAADDPYDLVVVSTAAINTVRDPDLASAAEGTAGRWRDEVEKTLAPVADRTRVVTVVDNVQFPRLTTCLRRSVLSESPTGDCLDPGEIDVSLRDASASAQQDAMTAIGGWTLDPTSAWCGVGPCRPIDDDGVPIFRDVSHFTVDESRRMGGFWTTRLGEVLADGRR